MRVYEVGGVSDAELDSAEAHKRAEIRGGLQSKVIAEMIKSPSSGVPKERAFQGRHLLVADRRALRHVAADRLRSLSRLIFAGCSYDYGRFGSDLL
jgi:hypothetical protein